MNKNSFTMISLSAMALFLVACSDSGNVNRKVPVTYKMATRQLPPQPVYSATRFVRPPEMNPSRDPEASNADVVIPIFNFSIQNRTLSETILVLAATVRYSSFCDKSIANRRLTLTTIGTVDEIAKEIQEKVKIKIEIDHQKKQVRFLPAQGVEPVLNKNN